MHDSSLLPSPVLHGDSRMSPRYGWSHLSSINKELTCRTGNGREYNTIAIWFLSPTGQSAEPPIHALLFIVLFPVLQLSPSLLPDSGFLFPYFFI